MCVLYEITFEKYAIHVKNKIIYLLFVFVCRLPYNASTIPYTLVKLLNNARYCRRCKTGCFSSYLRIFELAKILASEMVVTFDGPAEFVITENYYCSRHCAHLKSTNLM